MKKKELLIIFVLAFLMTWGSGFIAHPYPCRSFPDALCAGGYPLTFHKVGGVIGINEWYWLDFTRDLTFWFLVLEGGWWVVKWMGKVNK